jgi:hypothetical protein
MWLTLFPCKICKEINISGRRTFYQNNTQGVKNSVVNFILRDDEQNYKGTRRLQATS